MCSAASGATASGARSVPRVSSWSLSSAPCPGLATEHFTVLALVRFDMCQTLMAAAIYSLVSIYSVEFGLSLRPSSRWST